MSIRASLLATLILILTLVRPALADHDRWYAIELAGQRAGWSRTVETTQGDTIVSRSETRLEVKRGPMELTITMTSEFTETLGGRPLTLRVLNTLGAAPTTEVYTFGPTEVAVASTQGGQTTRSTRPLPEGEWLTPAAASRELQARLAGDAETFTIRTLDAAGGLQPVTMTHRVLERTTLDTPSGPVAAVKCEITVSNAPGLTTTEYFDEGGLPLRSQSQIGGLTMTMTATDRSVATTEMRAPELMLSTFIKPDRPIRSPRRLSRATYLLTVPEGPFPELPPTGSQTVERINDRSVRVTVTADPAEATRAADADRHDDALRDPTVILDAADPDIRALTGRSLADLAEGAPAPERAEAMRRFVYGFITEKDLGVGFATASEVAETRQGDCSEHAVLLAAMLRADGIPARVVAGLMYADQFAGERGIFGYHMWAQALLTIDGQSRWIDLDPTLPDTTPYDATHIAVALATLADGGFQTEMLGLAQLMGRLSISVESTGE